MNSVHTVVLLPISIAFFFSWLVQITHCFIPFFKCSFFSYFFAGCSARSISSFFSRFFFVYDFAEINFYYISKGMLLWADSPRTRPRRTSMPTSHSLGQCPIPWSNGTSTPECLVVLDLSHSPTLLVSRRSAPTTEQLNPLNMFRIGRLIDWSVTWLIDWLIDRRQISYQLSVTFADFQCSSAHAQGMPQAIEACRTVSEEEFFQPWSWCF